MFSLVLRRIWNSKWLMACLEAGFILVAAMVACVPLYTDGVLQYMLTRDMQDFQTAEDTYPGSYTWTLTFAHANTEQKLSEYEKWNARVEEEYLPQLEAPILTGTKVYLAKTLKYTASDAAHRTSDNAYLAAVAMDGWKDHVTVVRGRLPEDGIQEDGCVEVAISATAMQGLGLQLEQSYDFAILSESFGRCRFRVVGLVEQSDYADAFWFRGLSEYGNAVFMDTETFEKWLINDCGARGVTEVSWFRAMDYQQIGIDDLSGLLDILGEHQLAAASTPALKLDVPILDTLGSYAPRSRQLSATLWIILAPLLVMLCLYIVMVSRLVIRGDENEISVLRSRGAGAGQIFRMYLYEGLLLSGAAVVVGPFLGLLLCRVVGASNGFLEFISRAGLPLRLKWEAWLYALGAAVLFLAAMLLPAWQAARTTIVERKRKKSRMADRPFWQRYFLDVVLLGGSLYGCFTYNNQMAVLAQGGFSAADAQVDPLLFLLSSAFIIGAALLFLRIYPYLVQGIFWLGRKKWTPPVYAAFVHVGRSARQEQFLMLFLVLSIGVGIFSANFARSLNRHGEDSIRYSMGADVVLTTYWSNNSQDVAESGDENAMVTYIEPDFTPFRNMETCDAAAKVFVSEKGFVSLQSGISASVGDVTVMGIEPEQFGPAAWFRDDLADYPWYEYLNVLADAGNGVLVSENIAGALGLEPGDPFYFTYDNQTRVQCTVYAIIDHWPGCMPSEYVEEGRNRGGMVIANLSFLQAKFTRQPYEVWLHRAEDATDTMVNEELATMDITLQSVSYAGQQIITLKNDPLQQGINGMLTLSFLITMVITFIGFLIYWVMSIRGRVLQFGIFRAMGMTMQQVLGMLLCEQCLISLTAIVIGILLGGIASDLYVPLVQAIYIAAGKAIPFLVRGDRQDYFRIYAVLAVMLVSGMTVLGRTVAGTRIDQALKLGED